MNIESITFSWMLTNFPALSTSTRGSMILAAASKVHISLAASAASSMLPSLKASNASAYACLERLTLSKYGDIM